MKRMLAVILALMFVLGTCCFARAEEQKLTLILRGGSYTDVILDCLPAFEAEHGVTCEVLDLSFADLHSKIALDAVNAQGAYDLCMVDGSWMAEFASNNVLANLSEMGYAYDEDIIPATTAAGMLDGNVYLVPYFGNVTVFMYNKANLAAAGYDIADVDSWEDVLNIAAYGKANGNDGYLLRAQAGDNIVSDFLPVLLANGGWVIDGDNNVTINTPEFKAALEMYLELMKVGKILDKDDIVAAIDSGSATLALGWPGWYVPTAEGNASYTVVPTKLTEQSDPVSTSIYGCWFLGIANNSQNKELALELLTYITDAQVQKDSIKVGGVPCRYSCLLDEEILVDYPQLQTVCDALEVGVYRPLIEQWNDFTLALGAELDNCVQGVKTVDQTIADAQMACEMVMMM
ncbi:MAG: extracellular solute-binding protein [Clostridia bacterium]|nr:extracellular solute-binding protein [Clostridia bacterium]